MPGVSEKRAEAPEVSGFSKTEVALYVLLAVLALAVAVLAAHCAVHHVKRKRYVQSPIPEIGWDLESVCGRW